MAPRIALPALVAATFFAGFGVAELTGVRALGGIVLLAGGAWCAYLALRLAGPGPTLALIATALALFVASHPLGHAIGAWPAVGVSALLAALVAAAVTHIWRKEPQELAAFTGSATGWHSASRSGRRGVPFTAHE